MDFLDIADSGRRFLTLAFLAIFFSLASLPALQQLGTVDMVGTVLPKRNRKWDWRHLTCRICCKQQGTGGPSFFGAGGGHFSTRGSRGVAWDRVGVGSVQHTLERGHIVSQEDRGGFCGVEVWTYIEYIKVSH